MTVRDIDRGYQKTVVALKRLGHDLSIGVHESEGQEEHDEAEGLTVFDVAVSHEFGVPGKLPERSFVRSWFDERSAWFLKQLKGRVREIVKSKGRLSPARAATQLALLGAGDMKKRIAQNKIRPELSPERIEEKGSETVLLDSGQLESSIEGRAKAHK